jgi:hypothetical protein
MRKLLIVVLGAALGIAGTLAVQDVRAASATLSTVPAFDTAAVGAGGVLAAVNGNLCQQFGQPVGCQSVPLCTPVPISRNAATGQALYQSCTLYTLDGPGELAWAQDQLNYAQVGAYNLWASQQKLTFCVAWKAASGGAQAQALTDLGASAGLVPPCP